jgi:phenylalanyl-tRNA synthetase beta chain
LPADDVRRQTVPVVNPLDADRAALSTTLLPGLFDALVRNRARGFTDLMLHTVEQVVLPHRNPVAMPDPDVADRPTDAEYAQIKAAQPVQPVHVGVVLAGDRELRGWWGRAARPGGATRSRSRLVGAAAGVELRVTTASLPPCPGPVRRLRVGDWIVSHAGELHRRSSRRLTPAPHVCR